MTGWTQRDHELQLGAARDSVVNDHAALPCSRRVADPASVTVPLQHRLPQAAEMLFVLTPQRVAGRAHPLREYSLSTTTAVHRELDGLYSGFHRYIQHTNCGASQPGPQSTQYFCHWMFEVMFIENFHHSRCA